MVIMQPCSGYRRDMTKFMNITNLPFCFESTVMLLGKFWAGSREVAIMKILVCSFYLSELHAGGSTTLLSFLLRFLLFWPKVRITAESTSSGIGFLQVKVCAQSTGHSLVKLAQEKKEWACELNIPTWTLLLTWTISNKQANQPQKGDNQSGCSLFGKINRGLLLFRCDDRIIVIKCSRKTVVFTSA